MKKFKVFLVMCFCIFLSANLVACGKDEKKIEFYKRLDEAISIDLLRYEPDQDSINDVHNDMNNSNPYLSDEASLYKEEIEKRINALNQYAEVEFKDKSVNENIVKTINALKSMREGYDNWGLSYGTEESNDFLQEKIITQGVNEIKTVLKTLLNDKDFTPSDRAKENIEIFLESNERFFNPDKKGSEDRYEDFEYDGIKYSIHLSNIRVYSKASYLKSENLFDLEHPDNAGYLYFTMEVSGKESESIFDNKNNLYIPIDYIMDIESEYGKVDILDNNSFNIENYPIMASVNGQVCNLVTKHGITKACFEKKYVTHGELIGTLRVFIPLKYINTDKVLKIKINDVTIFTKVKPMNGVKLGTTYNDF